MRGSYGLVQAILSNLRDKQGLFDVTANLSITKKIKKKLKKLQHKIFALDIE